MKLAIPFVASLLGTAYAQTLKAHTPSDVTQCNPTILSWEVGQGYTFFISIVLASDPNGTAIETLPTQHETQVTWVANIAAGTTVEVYIVDQANETSFSDPFTIGPSDNDSCL